MVLVPTGRDRGLCFVFVFSVRTKEKFQQRGVEIPVRKYFMLSQVIGRFLDAEEMEEKRIVVRHETYKMGLLWAFQLVNKLPTNAVLSVLYPYSLVQNPPSVEGKKLPTRFTLWDYSPSMSRADTGSCVFCSYPY